MSAQPEQDDRRRPKVVYVMGAGRSGSTILGVALGNCAGVFYAGELESWLWRSGVPDSGDEERTRFWDAIREQVRGEDLYGKRVRRLLEHSAAALRFYDWPARRRLRSRYLAVTEALYRAIADTAEATHIVDTSHYPLRARELRRMSGVEVHLVYLARSPHKVIASFSRRDTPKSRKAPLATHVYLWLTHLVSIVTFLRHPHDRRMVLCYEDFAADPKRVLGQLMDALEISTAAPELTSLERGIPFQGNRLLRFKTITFRQSSDQPEQRSTLISLLHFPWTFALARLRPRVGSSPAEDRDESAESLVAAMSDRGL
jgi:hypothetical protein